MPLVLPKLARKLGEVFAKHLQDPARVADEWGQAYQEYAQEGMAGTTQPILTGSEWSRFSALLKPVLAVPAAGNPATLAAAIGAGITAFWYTPPVPWASKDGLFVGVTATPGGPIAIPCLVPVLSVPKPSEIVAAAGIAACMETATRATIVTVTNTTTGATVPSPIL